MRSRHDPRGAARPDLHGLCRDAVQLLRWQRGKEVHHGQRVVQVAQRVHKARVPGPGGAGACSQQPACSAMAAVPRPAARVPAPLHACTKTASLPNATSCFVPSGRLAPEGGVLTKSNPEGAAATLDLAMFGGARELAWEAWGEHLSFTRWSRRWVGRAAARRCARSRFFLACAFLILRSYACASLHARPGHPLTAACAAPSSPLWDQITRAVAPAACCS